MSVAATETTPPRGGGGNWLSRAPLLGVPNWLWILIAGVGGGTVFILWRNHQKAAAAATTAPAATATTTASACTDANGNPVDCNSMLAVNSEGQAEYEQLNSQLTGLSGQSAALAAAIQQQQGQTSTTPATPAPAAPAVPTGESLVGSGYNAAGGPGSTVTGANGTQYQWVNGAQAQAAAANGQSLFYQTYPGQFVAAQPGTTFAQGTPLFQVV